MMLAIAAAEHLKGLLQGSEKLEGNTPDDSDARRTDSKDASVQQEQGELLPAQETERSRSFAFIANNMHFSTFVPLVIIQVLEDIDLGLGGVVCVLWVLLALLVSWLLFRRGYINVFPKKYDFFNLQLYITVTVLAYTVQRWTHNWISVYVNGSNAWFMWASILLPCYDNFVMDSVRDRIPTEAAAHPLVKRMALLIAITWAASLTTMTVAAIIPAALNFPPKQMGLVITLCSYVFGLGPMLVAVVVQHVIKVVYGRKIKAAFVEQVQQQREQGGQEAV